MPTIITKHSQTHLTPLPSDPSCKLTIVHIGNNSFYISLRDSSNNEQPLSLPKPDDLLAFKHLIDTALLADRPSFTSTTVPPPIT